VSRNQKSLLTGKSLKLSVNEYADQTFDEFMKHKGGLFGITNEHLKQVPESYFTPHTFRLGAEKEEFPESVDWREGN